MTVLNRQPGREKLNEEHILPFESLYEQYYKRVYRYFRAHLEHEEDAADLTQQVFFQVWMHLSTYQPGKGSFATWLFSIAHHRLVDFFRAVRISESWESLYEIAITDLNPEEKYRRQEAEKKHPDLWEPAIPTFLSVLYQVYAASPPTVRLAFLRQKTPVMSSHTASL